MITRFSPRTVVVVGVLLAVLAGHAMPLQARINGEMGIRLQDAVAAALVSMVVALTVILAATLGTRGGRRGLSRLGTETRSGSIRWWNYLAGIMGAVFVVVMAATAPIVGLAIYTVVVVAGQTVSGLMVDRLGLGPGGRRKITTARGLGVVLAIAGVLVAVSPRLSGLEDPVALLVPILAVFASGVIMSIQHGFNGTVAARAGSPLPGTLVNYILGAIVLLAVWLVKLALDGHLPVLPREPWLYAAGALGTGNLILSAILTRHIGILVTGLGMIAGQLIGALALDMLFPAEGTAIYVQTVVGIVIVLAAMFLAALGPRRPRVRPGAGGEQGKKTETESVATTVGGTPAD